MPLTNQEIAQANIDKVRAVMNPLLAHLLGTDEATVQTMHGSLLRDIVLQPRTLTDMTQHYGLTLSRIVGTHKRGEMTADLHQQVMNTLAPVFESVFPNYRNKPNPSAERCEKVFNGFTAMFAPYGARFATYTRPAKDMIKRDRVKPMFDYFGGTFVTEASLYSNLQFFSEKYIAVLGGLIVIATAEKPVQERKATLLKKDMPFLAQFPTCYLNVLTLRDALPPAPAKVTT